MRSLIMDSMPCIWCISIPSVSIINLESSVRILTLGIFSEPLMVASSSVLTCAKNAEFFFGRAKNVMFPVTLSEYAKNMCRAMFNVRKRLTIV